MGNCESDSRELWEQPGVRCYASFLPETVTTKRRERSLLGNRNDDGGTWKNPLKLQVIPRKWRATCEASWDLGRTRASPIYYSEGGKKGGKGRGSKHGEYADEVGCIKESRKVNKKGRVASTIMAILQLAWDNHFRWGYTGKAGYGPRTLSQKHSQSNVFEHLYELSALYNCTLWRG